MVQGNSGTNRCAFHVEDLGYAHGLPCKATPMRRRSRWMVQIALLLLSGQVLSADTTAPGLQKAAESAYDAKRYAESVRLYDQLFVLDAPEASDSYNAACSAALAGDAGRAFELLNQAIGLGFASDNSLRHDSDLASLRTDERWAALMTRFHATYKWLDVYDVLNDARQPANQRYLHARQALDGGLLAPPNDVSPFLQFYATVASFVGDYDTADRLYLPGKPVDPVAAGHIHAAPANAALLSLARGRQAVFLNESHGRAQSRAAIYTLLEPLRSQGFKYLAMETITPSDEPAANAACPGNAMHDAGLQARGYPTIETGYYTREPVYGEIIRHAIALGFVLVRYEAKGDEMNTQATREEAEARNLACLIKSDPSARLVVLAGFSHISEAAEHPLAAGGMMARRFTRMTGIDPLTIDTTSLLREPPAALVFPQPKRNSNPSEAFVLLDDAGAPYSAQPGYDVSVLVRSPANRNGTGRSWLELGGARERTHIDALGCKGKRPCLVEARRNPEPDAAIIGDGCLIAAGEADGCDLFLTRGTHRVLYLDAKMNRLSESVIKAD